MKKFHKTLIIDIETVSQFPDFDKVPPSLKGHWERKSKFLKYVSDISIDHLYFEKAGIYAEFGKIICISLGYFTDLERGFELRIKAIYGKNERKILEEFIHLIEQFENRAPGTLLKFVGHNIKEFDLPFICRRLLVHRLAIPPCLKITNLKPWEIPHEDTLSLWRFGDYKHYISLDLLATILGVESSKTDMDGSQVNEIYWKDGALKKIAKYCQDDVLTTAKTYLRLQGICEEVTPVYT